MIQITQESVQDILSDLRCATEKLKTILTQTEQESHRVAFSAGFVEGEKSVAPAPKARELSDDEIMDLSRAECGNFRWPSSAINIGRAVLAAMDKS